MGRASLRIARAGTRRRSFRITLDGDAIRAYAGETIGAALVAAGRRTAGTSLRRGEARGMFCGVGLCHECRMIVDGVADVRVCQEPARPGCAVRTQRDRAPAGETS